MGHAELAGGQQPGPAGTARRRATVQAAGNRPGIRPGPFARQRRLGRACTTGTRPISGAGQARRSRTPRPGAAGLAEPARDYGTTTSALRCRGCSREVGPGRRCELIWATWRFWWLHGHAEELVRHADRILSASDVLPSHQRALALSGAGFAHFAGGDQARARRLFKQSLPLYRKLSDRLGLGLTAPSSAGCWPLQQQVAIATQLLEQTIRRAAQDGRSAADRAGARALPARCRARGQLPWPDPAPAGRSSAKPRNCSPMV